MKVKPLDWKLREFRESDDWYADCVIGQYCAADIHGVPKLILRTIEDGLEHDKIVGSYASVAKARSAGNRHFAKLIRAQLQL